MKGMYQVRVELGRQEDGLWRAEVPELAGCWVDAPTLAEAISHLQGVIAMAIDDYDEQEWPLPGSVEPLTVEPEYAVVPVMVPEHSIRRGKRPLR